MTFPGNGSKFYRHCFTLVAGLALWSLWAQFATAQDSPRVDVVLGPNAPPLEKFAASELAEQFQKLFNAKVEIGEALPEKFDHLIVLGSPATNPAIAKLGKLWPKVGDQGHLLRSVDWKQKRALIVAGESPVATLWGVYELGRHFGIRYMLFGDLYPIEPPQLQLGDIDLVFQPKLQVRAWRTINDFAIGPESWGLAEHQKVLRQLAKLKYNRVVLSLYAWQPFVDFEFGGVHKETGVLWYGYQYPVDGDIAGRGVFRGAKLFENPDFVGAKTYADRVQAGTRLASGIINEAKKLGMETGISLSPLEFPREFAAALPGAKKMVGLEDLTIGPGANQRIDDPRMMGLVKKQIQAYLDTYPNVDHLYLTLPEFPEWSEQAEESWKALDARTGVGRLTSLDKLTDAARSRKLIGSGDRGIRALRGNITALEFFGRLLAEKDFGKTSTGKRVTVTLVEVDSALYSVLDRVLPKGVETLHFVDYTARRVAANRELLKQVPTQKIPSSLILTLADDNVGVLPQMSYTALATLVEELKAGGWLGFSTRYWAIGDLDLATTYLSRASFANDLSPREVLTDLLTPVLGAGTIDRTVKAFDLVEEATNLIDDHDVGFSFPIPNVIMKHYASTEPVPAWWGEAKDKYAQAMDEMYRVNTRAREGGRQFSLYFARRFEFGAEYISCIESVRRAAIAKSKNDHETHIAELEKAVESLNTALNALAAVARSNSDRGMIAVLNQYGYRPLKKELESQ